MNYGELKLLVASYLHRDDLTSEIPGFIEAGITRMNRDLRIQEMIETSEGPIFTNPFELPPGVLEIREVSREAARGRCQLRSVSRHELNSYSDEGDNPTLYSFDGLEIETRPSSVGIDIRVIHYKAIVEPENDTDEDAVLTKYPMLWLYGALIEGWSWIQDNEQQSKATDMFVSEIDLANRASNMSELGESPKMQGASTWL